MSPEANPNDCRIEYIEFPALDIARSKEFFTTVFGWKFEDYGPDYTSFADGRLAGGFDKHAEVASGGPLVVIYAADLEAVQSSVITGGGSIVKPIFSFPGGRRFHFKDPNGNEMAAWSEEKS
jgi:uncharacterized protein